MQSHEAAGIVSEMSPEDKEANTFRLKLSVAIRAITYVLDNAARTDSEMIEIIRSSTC
jgi:hypothetical protein